MDTFVGRREQPEYTSQNVRLRELANCIGLNCLKEKFSAESIERLEMVDIIYLKSNKAELACLWEVENSTNFSSAIQRGSNAHSSIPKFMVIPDTRENELKRTIDPLFGGHLKKITGGI